MSLRIVRVVRIVRIVRVVRVVRVVRISVISVFVYCAYFVKLAYLSSFVFFSSSRLLGFSASRLGVVMHLHYLMSSSSHICIYPSTLALLRIPIFAYWHIRKFAYLYICMFATASRRAFAYLHNRIRAFVVAYARCVGVWIRICV